MSPESPVCLSRVERAILSNQYRILSFLEPGEKPGYDMFQKILEEGYVRHYESLLERVNAEEMSYDLCEEVLDTLDAFEALEDFKRANGPSQVPDWLKFNGYDANNKLEARMSIYADFYCNGLGTPRFETLGIKNFNSQSPRRDYYQKIVAAWKNSTNINNLSSDDVARIVAAANR